MADWEDEEDAFLYGGSTSTSAAPTASTSTAGALKAESGTPQPPGQNANPPISMHEQSTVERADEGEGEADMDEGQDEDEAQDEEDEEEESDDDFQIIMDTTTAPSSHHDLSRKVGAVPVRPAPGPSLVKELPRQDSQQPTSAGRYADSGSPLKPSPAGGTSNPLVSLQSSIHATGSPIPAPGRTPPPDLNDTSATYTLTRKDENETRPEPQPIVDIDLESIEDKKWRKPGAYLSDYFNYGFDEASWKDWCQKQHTMRKDRDREREHPFHVFADRPLPEAWAALPMELKGMMMQTIMSSFNGASGSQQQQQQQMMQGMMPGMQGMQGNPMAMGNMGGMPMGGMPMGNMGMMGGPGQQHRGMNGGFGGPGMQQQNRNR